MCYATLVQRFEPHGRRLTNFHYYYYEHGKCVGRVKAEGAGVCVGGGGGVLRGNRNGERLRDEANTRISQEKKTERGRKKIVIGGVLCESLSP